MSAPFCTALSLLGAALALAVAALGVWRLLRPPSRRATPPGPAVGGGAGTGSWHLAGLGALLQVPLVLLLAWAVIFADLARARSPGLLGLAACLLILALGLAQAWRRGLLEAAAPQDADRRHGVDDS